MNSLSLDYAARQKIGGMHLDFHHLKQLPLLPPDAFASSDLAYIVPRVLELVYTAWDMAPFAADLWNEADEALRERLQAQSDVSHAATGGHKWDPPEWAGGEDCPAPFAPFKWDEGRRAVLRAELDAYYARLYGLTRKQLRYILDPADLTPGELQDILGPREEVGDPLDVAGYRARVAASDFPGETFRVLKEKEEKAHGEYRTRRLVLEAWARLEAELGPVVVRNYREQGADRDGGQEIAESGAKHEARVEASASAGARPAFGATRPEASAPPTAAPQAPASGDQTDLFGAAVGAPKKADAGPLDPKRPPEPPRPVAAQPVLIPSPPQGDYAQRLKRVMGLRGKRTSEEIGELVAGLGDEDGNIRWLAASVLQSIGGGAARALLIATLKAFIDQAPSDAGREEAEKLLGKLQAA